MPKFRKRPIVIEAIQWAGGNETEIQEWAGGACVFHSVDVEDRAEDPDITAEVWDKLHSTWVGVKTGQWLTTPHG